MVGKTTFIKSLLKKLNEMNYPVLPQHFGLIPAGWDYYWDYLKFMNQRVIMDRFILSEVVYGQVIRGYSKITPETYRMLDANLRLNASVTVVIVGDAVWYEKQVNEIHSQRTEAFSIEQNIAVNEKFKDVAYSPSYDVDFVWQVSDSVGYPAESFVAQVIKLYAERMARWEALYGQE